jgi:hypothetical protein
MCVVSQTKRESTEWLAVKLRKRKKNKELRGEEGRKEKPRAKKLNEAFLSIEKLASSAISFMFKEPNKF